MCPRDFEGWPLQMLLIQCVQEDKGVQCQDQFLKIEKDPKPLQSLVIPQNGFLLLLYPKSFDHVQWVQHHCSQAILRNHVDTFGHKGLIEDTPEAINYLHQHNCAMAWAKCNRELIAHRFMECLTEKPISHYSKVGDGSNNRTSDGSECVIDIWHNCVLKREFFVTKEDGKTEKEELWLHRKGAAPSDAGPIIIPGSRGAFSYLVLPVSDVNVQQSSGFSLAHGAGRRLPRNVAQKKGENMKGDLTITNLGSRVICEKKDLLFEEIPDAYKDIESIVTDLVSFGLVTVIAKLRPLITYKTRVKVYGKVAHRKDNNKDDDDD